MVGIRQLRYRGMCNNLRLVAFTSTNVRRIFLCDRLESVGWAEIVRKQLKIKSVIRIHVTVLDLAPPFLHIAAAMVSQSVNRVRRLSAVKERSISRNSGRKAKRHQSLRLTKHFLSNLSAAR